MNDLLPGSLKAKVAGCICSGDSYLRKGERHYWITSGCPVHDADSDQNWLDPRGGDDDDK
jgi:hypothetical protein